MAKTDKPEIRKEASAAGSRPGRGKAANNITVPVKISANLDSSLRKVCKRKKIARSEAVRTAIRLFIEQHAQTMIEGGAS